MVSCNEVVAHLGGPTMRTRRGFSVVEGVVESRRVVVLGTRCGTFWAAAANVVVADCFESRNNKSLLVGFLSITAFSSSKEESTKTPQQTTTVQRETSRGLALLYFLSDITISGSNVLVDEFYWPCFYQLWMGNR